jgi:stage V sporulation protein R
VRVGDFVVFPKQKPVGALSQTEVAISINKILHRRLRQGEHRIPVGPNLAKFLGYFIAEGNAQERGLVGFGFHANEKEYQAEVAGLASTLFGVNVATDLHRSSRAATVRFNSLEVARWLRNEIGHYGHSKRLPAFLLEGDEATIISCLQGLFNGDGTYANNKSRKSGSLTYSTTSEQLAYQMRHACLRLGIRTVINRRQRAGRLPAYELVWTGSSAHKLSELLLQKDVIRGNRSFERSWMDDNYVYQQVRSIETEEYAGDVHNFSVEDDESYTLAAGMVVHNCDFFKNNAFFAHTSRKMMDEMANHGARMRRYVEKYGEDEVENFMDRCMSIDDLIDVHSTFIKRRDEVSRYDFTEKEQEEAHARRFKSKGYMEDYINPPEVLRAEEEERRKQREQTERSFPEHPEKDVLLFLIQHAPLKPWQRDVLSIVRDEAYYFAPQGQTKIMNEGWACVHYNSLIYTNQGLIPAGELVEKRLGAKVSDGQTTQTIYDWAKFENRETVTMRTRRGLVVTGSTNHRVFLPDGTWRRLDALQVGDRVTVSGGHGLWAKNLVEIGWQPSRRPTLTDVAVEAGVDIETVIRYRRGYRGRYAERITTAVAEYDNAIAVSAGKTRNRREIRVPAVVDTQLAAFLGYLIGDGHISAVKRTIGLTTGDEEQADAFAALVQKLFGLETKRRWDTGRWRVGFSSEDVKELLLHLGLKTGPCARTKEVPSCILRSPQEVVAAFLRAYFDCDGYAGKQGVILSTTSDKLAEVVQLLLLNFNILSRRRKNKDGCWHVHVMGKSAEVFLREIGFGLQRKQEALEKYVSSHHWYKEEEWTDEVVSLERGRADVYDISVTDTHRYAAQGFINHNSYWHSTIMTTKSLHPSEVVDYCDHHSGTMAPQRGRVNPYKLGIELLRDIEKRWNTGRFGREYEECDDQEKKRHWDKQLGLGRKKIFEVRKMYNDILFIDEFLTPEFVQEHQYFSYMFNAQGNNYVIESREFQKIKQRLLFNLTNFGKPIILVVDGNFRNRGELLLRHEFNGLDLQINQAQDTLTNLHAIWGRPVHVQTVLDNKPTLLSFDGTEHTNKPLGANDDPRRQGPTKTK